MEEMRLPLLIIMFLVWLPPSFGDPGTPQNTNVSGAISVGRNVQVSAKNGDRAHWEVRIAADPADSQHLLACSYIHSGKQNAYHSIVYASSDGGKSWAPTLESGPADFVFDPDCVFGLNGAAYFSVLTASR